MAFVADPCRSDTRPRIPTLGQCLTASLWFGFALLATVSPGIGLAETPTAPPTSTADSIRCVHCHDRRQALAVSPADNPVPPQARSRKRFDTSSLDQSAHPQLTCLDCHRDAQPLPHSRHLSHVNCQSPCHVSSAIEYRRSVHALARAKQAQAPDCATCHGGHQVVAALARKKTARPQLISHMCLPCHQTHATAVPPTSAHAEPATDSLDGLHQRPSSHVLTPTCVHCHRHHAIVPVNDPASPTASLALLSTCARCHRAICLTYRQSVHGQALLAATASAPSCNGCHPLHKPPPDESSATAHDTARHECGDCHDEQKSNAPASLYQLYRLSPHGRPAAPGRARPAALCSDCHGTHLILSTRDPQCMLIPSNRRFVCLKCHDNHVMASFDFDHFTPLASTAPPLVQRHRWPLLPRFAMALIVLMAAIHRGLWQYRWARTAECSSQDSMSLPRTDGSPDASLSASSLRNGITVFIVLLAITGLIHSQATHFWGRLIAGILGGPDVIAQVHRLIGVAMFVYLFAGFLTACRRGLRRAVREHLAGSGAIWPALRDFADVGRVIRWFWRGGKPPRFTGLPYWRKVTVWAVIVLVGAAGGTGALILLAKLVPAMHGRAVSQWAVAHHGQLALALAGTVLLVIGMNFGMHPPGDPKTPADKR